MVTLQFVRCTDCEIIIDNSHIPVTHKKTRVGNPMLSFVSDVEIEDILVDKVSHLYWELVDVLATHNAYTAKRIQSIYRQIFDRIPSGKAMDIATFEKAMIDFGIEVPTYSVASITDSQGKELVCDMYFCINTAESRSIVEQLCTAELYHLLKTGRIIKRCEHCGKLFVPNKADEKYCIRSSKEYPGKNCKQAVKYGKQLQRERGEESVRIYKSINTMLSKRARDATIAEKEQAQTILYSFRNEAAILKRKLKNGDIQEKEYIEWLNSFKKRGKKKTPPPAM